MEASEIEFMAEKEKIEIIPNFAHAAMHLIQARSPDAYFLNLLIQGEVGPFKPGISLSCPLWLAVNLKQRQRCRIVCPAWMEVCPSIVEQISQLNTTLPGGEVRGGKRPRERKSDLH